MMYNYFLFGLFVYYVYRRWTRVDCKLSVIPGPTGWDLLANVLELSPSNIHLKFMEWSETYGKLFRVNMLGTQILITSDPDVLHEELVTKGQQCAGRPVLTEGNLFSEGGQDIVLSQPSQRWRNMRKIAHTSLKMYDKGLERIEKFSMRMIGALLDTCAAHGGAAFDPKPHLYLATMNITTLFLVGQSYEPDSRFYHLFREFEERTWVLLSSRLHGVVAETFPWAPFVHATLTRRADAVRQSRRKLWDLMVAEAQKSEADGFHQSLVSLFRKALAEGQDDVTELTAELVCGNVIIGGASTTTNTTYAFLNTLTYYPEVQAKLQKEVDDVIGERAVTLSDRARMPYMQATLLEILRYTSIIPLGVTHLTLADVTLGGHHIPANTNIFNNLFGLHHDKRHFPQPYHFRPERYLDETGNVVAPDHPARRALLPFSAGPRVCFGETLAKSRLFLLIASLIQRFDVVSDVTKVSCDPRRYVAKGVLHPPEYKIKMISRLH